MERDPFDKTVWDPIDPEQAIEDPFHGPTAIQELLNTPPMRLPDGTYHVFGGYYLCGTTSFDGDGRPFIKFKSMPSPAEMFHEAQAIQSWAESYRRGELPPREEMNLPEFQYSQPPYFIIEEPEQ